MRTAAPRERMTLTKKASAPGMRMSRSPTVIAPACEGPDGALRGEKGKLRTTRVVRCRVRGKIGTILQCAAHTERTELDRPKHVIHAQSGWRGHVARRRLEGIDRDEQRRTCVPIGRRRRRIICRQIQTVQCGDRYDRVRR